ncbi:unnamed protein product [Phyllotreta striolata]|uniref:p53 DNA-binding domain-containing protein n=1 Tax=Phyllotreta striolata TaxID=444603 RepID=A0A9N9TQW4_PHYSR|nr:unnamed protein product [Phyllotreta striolata]
MSFQSELLSKEDESYILAHVDLDDPSLFNLSDEISIDDFQEQKYSLLLHNEQTVALNGNYQNTHDYYPADLPKEAESIKLEDQKLNVTQGEFQGPYDFQVIVCTGSKNPWEYSAQLNKIYTDRKSPVPIDFIVKNNSPDTQLFVRVTPMFNSPQYAQDCVYRCPNHEFNGPSDELPKEKCHIVKCLNKNTEYYGDKAKGDRLSFVIPLARTDRVRERFEFYCLNSCPAPGINRKPVEIVFTLEDIHGNTLGRKNLNVRICSCPRRDREKDENIPAAKSRKRGMIVAKKPSKKASVVLSRNLQELTVPVLGPQMRNNVLKYVHDLYAGEILRCGDDIEKQQPYLQGLESVKTIIAKFNDNESSSITQLSHF